LSVFNPTLHEGVQSLMRFGLTDRSAAAAVAKTVIGQAYLMSSLDLFYLFGWTVLVLIPLCWAARRPAGAVVVGGD
jgi:DHA2 family multidrug resistance protein